MPKGWVSAKLHELISSEGIFCDGDWVESKDQDPNGEIRLIQLADIGDGHFIDKSYRFLTKSKAKLLKCTYLKKGDVLVARMPDPLGRAIIFPLDDTERYVTVVDVAIIRFGNDFVLNKYCCYIINALPTRNTIAGMQSGTTRKRIARTKLETVAIPLPPFAEQHRIVAKIDALFSRLDKGVETLQNLQQQLRIYRQAVLKWAFEGKLANCKNEKWGYVTLGSICKISSGGTPSRSVSKYYSGNIPWIKTGEIKWNKITNSEEHITAEAMENSSAKYFPVGTILVAMYGQGLTRGRASILGIRATTNQAVCALIPTNSIESSFLYYYFQCNYWNLREKAVGGNQLNLNCNLISKLGIMLPPKHEQATIVSEIESRLSVCDKLEAIVEENLNKAQALKQSILKKAFAGQLVPQDPNDEPAEKLLECIKAGRQSETVRSKTTRKSKRG